MSYIDETIVKVQAQQGSAHASLLLHRPLNDALDGGQGLRANVVVEVWREAILVRTSRKS